MSDSLSYEKIEETRKVQGQKRDVVACLYIASKQEGSKKGMAAAAAGKLERTTFETSRAMEYFSERELEMQIGHPRYLWPFALLKELIDNALDACDDAGIAPVIEVTIEPDAMIVQDNGPGLPAATLKGALDYTVRVSDKAHYVSPTRGQLGNALKTVWAASFIVSDGQQRGHVRVIARDIEHNIVVTLNEIEQEPRIEDHPKPVPADDVITGTQIALTWPEIASYLCCIKRGDSYMVIPKLWELLSNFAAWNPHATFRLATPGGGHMTFRASEQAWSKWRPCWPTSPHWYTPENLRGLIAAYITHELQAGERAKTINDFVGQFAGLTGSLKRKAVTDAAGLTGKTLADLVHGDTVDKGLVERLLEAMVAEARPIAPEKLGIIGEAHLTHHLTSRHDVAPSSVRYKRIAGTDDGMPFVVEVAFGVRKDDDAHQEMDIGLNWSAALYNPFGSCISILLDEARIDFDDPVAIAIHVACPRLKTTDRGKTTVELTKPMQEALANAIRLTTIDWTVKKWRDDRDERAREKSLKQLRKEQNRGELTIKDAAYEVMEESYLYASGNNQYPAGARQVMYVARDRVLRLTGGKCWDKSSYFTQTLLPNFVEEHKELTKDWDVIYDSRGHFSEPHTRRRVDIGTLGVREYVKGWNKPPKETPRIVLPSHYPTFGPDYRYKFALFIEKEGFWPLLERAQIAERFDIALFSTKGMSTTACRQLVEALTVHGVTILVLRDFDKWGFSIFGTLRGNTRRHTYKTKPKVIDLGLRLADVKAMGLSSEPVNYGKDTDPRAILREHGATEEEIAFLVKEKGGNGVWKGDRVELNAMTSPQIVAFVEQKLIEEGAGKIIPNETVLRDAYVRAVRRKMVEEAANKAMQEAMKLSIDVPTDLFERVSQAIAGRAVVAWDEALQKLI